MKKGDSFKTNFSKETYKIAGRWHEFFILSPQGSDEECLLYTKEEFEELLQSGEFIEEK